MQSFIEKKSKMHAMKTNPTINNRRGFTLVELMVVVLLTAIAVIAIYRGYTAFSHSADAQEQIIEMQQNLRVGMYMIEKDIRRAGMNEEDDENAGFWGFWLDATIDEHDPPDPSVPPDPLYAAPRFWPDPIYESSYISFTMDLGGTDRDKNDEPWNNDDPGDSDLDDNDEWITYTLEPASLPLPADPDKLPPPPWTNFFNLVKTDENKGGDPDNDSVPDVPDDMTMINNVDALNFVYLSEDLAVGDEPVDDPDDSDMDDLDPDTTPDVPTTGRNFLPESRMGLVRSVQVCLLVRTTNEDYRYTNKEQYRNLQGSLIYQAPGDNFRRRIFCKEIKIRNAGL
jgi:prepilin-type N-terminal cleavage/methylation domain-containing protein